MKTIEQRTAIAAACGWRRWRFGDSWCKGLRLADKRFNGYVRRVIEDAPANSPTVKLNIDEAWTCDASEIVANYTPVSHWLKNNQILFMPPNYLGDLNAMHEAEKILDPKGKDGAYEYWLRTVCHIPERESAKERYFYRATAAERAEAFLKTLNLWKD